MVGLVGSGWNAEGGRSTRGVFVHVDAADGTLFVVDEPAVDAFGVEEVGALERPHALARIEVGQTHRAPLALAWKTPKRFVNSQVQCA